MGTTSLINGGRHITELRLEGEGAWPDLRVGKLSPQLNVVYGPPRSGKSSVAQLVGHLLYGRSEGSWRDQFGQSTVMAEGAVEFEDVEGDFLLKRQFDGQRNPWLTISSNQGDAVDGNTIQNLLGGLSPQLASTVFFADFAESPRAATLLSETFAREFTSSKHIDRDSSSLPSYACCSASEPQSSDRVDRRRVDELVKRRDSIAGEIEQQLARRRSESDQLEREINEIDASLTSRRERVDHLRSQLSRVENDLAETETRLRYLSLDGQRALPNGPQDDDAYQSKLAELDDQIARCRQTLAESQQREQVLRAELAQYGSDGTADRVTCLADGRVTLGVLEQLLDDLDTEVSQLARAHEPGRCVSHEAHAKLSPVASLLRQQVYTLCGQLTEQERIVRREQLMLEIRQLTRVQSELGDRLDLLLSRREVLVQQRQTLDQPVRLTPLPPVAGHCDCQHHGDFVQHDESMLLSRANRNGLENDARNRLTTLQAERTTLVNQLRAENAEIELLEQRWEVLQQQRAGLISRASTEQQQAELDRLETVIRHSLAAGDQRPAQINRDSWKASDVLAQLSNGQLVQIRLDRQQSQPTIIDRRGQARAIANLSPREHDQLYLALTLSLVNSYAQRGIHLPLVLDEPFLQQDDAHAAVMAGVLDEFARSGHQLLVFTEDHSVRRRFASLNAKVFDLESLRLSQPAAINTTKTVVPPPTVTTSTRIVRETRDGHATPVLRLATVDGDLDNDDLFYLTEDSTFAEFPVLGVDTDAIFRRIEIHSVGDLLGADPQSIANQLARTEISAETVHLWQVHMALMSHVPNLTLNDAQVLAACGIDSPVDLFEVDIDALHQAVDQFLSSESGRRFNRNRTRYSRTRLGEWRDGAQRYRDRWQRSKSRYTGWSRRRSAARTSHSRSNHNGATRTHKRTDRPKRAQTQTRATTTRTRKFYLNRSQDVEEAPSIGPKTAERLAKVGIRSVEDLLAADPESTAAELDVSHIKADTIADWQHQARLVCQIPGLRGYGAQLLVACGLTQPEQVARTTADQLVAQVLSFCQTKEGQRILRSGDPPQSEKIAEWVELAAQSRPLEAA